MPSASDCGNKMWAVKKIGRTINGILLCLYRGTNMEGYKEVIFVSGSFIFPIPFELPSEWTVFRQYYQRTMCNVLFSY